MAESPPDLEALDLDDLKRLVLQLLEEIAALRAENAALRAEIARLKGLKGCPKIKPSGMDKKATARRQTKERRKQARRSKKNAQLHINEERILKAEVPPGARFKGYESYVVQDLVVRPHSVRYRRERWLTPSGETLVAPLPAGIEGHFGAELRRFVLALYHQGQSTLGRVVALLRDLGVVISKRQVIRLLNEGQARFTDEARAVLRAGLQSAVWVSVDDTGARHRTRNGVCTQIGNDRFAWFATGFSKSRRTFLELLRAGHEDYLVNDAALAYMRKRHLAGPVVARLQGAANHDHEGRHFADEAAWMAHLDALGITDLEVQPDPVKIATEGALWGSITGHGLIAGSVILSDDAGQFNVGHHALCWVHAERLIHKLDCFTAAQAQAKERIRARIWWLYADLKAYRENPTRRRRRELCRRFDDIFTTRTGFATLDRLLARLHANKEELLVVLERPEVPLNTNGSENDIRCQVTRRKISGGTRSEAGREARDTFLGLMKTCAKLGIPFWDYLGHRLKVPGAPAVCYLPDLVRQHAAPA
jgi:hypothetical protein